LETGQAHVWNAYARVVRPEGAPAAREMMAEVFEHGAATWRGLGVLPQSGWVLRSAFARFDARVRFGSIADAETASTAECIAGDILRGVQRPVACPLFGSRCTPAHPCGAPMVSAEGICAAYYLYKRTSAAVDGRGDG
jgi:hydrogenase expression/formation protein HypD